MAVREEYLPALEWFFTQVDQKLNLPKNVSKIHWKHFSAEFLLKQMRDEVDELEREIEGYVFQEIGGEPYIETDREAVIKECADVAAFAMMIADLFKEGNDA